MMTKKGFNTVMTSAYISAMILSGLSQARSTTVLASALDPKALSSAVAGLRAAGFAGQMPDTTEVSVPASGEVAYSNSSVAIGPGSLTDEGMARLRTRAMQSQLTPKMPSEMANLFSLGNASAIDTKQLKYQQGNAWYYVIFSLAPNSDDVIFAWREGDVAMFYLTSTNRQLRAAGRRVSGNTSLILNNEAQASYETSLSLWGGLANNLLTASR